MLFRQSFWAGLADGSVTVAFRRWKRPTVKTGGRQTTPAGVLAIDDVVETDEGDITDADARRAGLPTATRCSPSSPGDSAGSTGSTSTSPARIPASPCASGRR